MLQLFANGALMTSKRNSSSWWHGVGYRRIKGESAWSPKPNRISSSSFTAQQAWTHPGGGFDTSHCRSRQKGSAWSDGWYLDPSHDHTWNCLPLLEQGMVSRTYWLAIGFSPVSDYSTLKMLSHTVFFPGWYTKVMPLLPTPRRNFAPRPPVRFLQAFYWPYRLAWSEC